MKLGNFITEPGYELMIHRCVLNCVLLCCFCLDLNVECSSALLYEDGKLFGRFTAVGNPDPVCTRRDSKGIIARIKCESNGLVEMTPSDVNVSLSARNSAELEKSCFIINVGR